MFKLLVIKSGSFNNYKLLEQSLVQIDKHFFKDRDVCLLSDYTVEELLEQFAKSYSARYSTFEPAIAMNNKVDKLQRIKVTEMSDGLVYFWDGLDETYQPIVERMQDMGKPVFIIPFNLIGKS